MENAIELSMDEQIQLVELLKKLRHSCGVYIADHTDEYGAPDYGYNDGVDEAKRQMNYCHEIIDLLTLSW